MQSNILWLAVLLVITTIYTTVDANDDIVEKGPCEDTEGAVKIKCETKVFKDYLKCIEKNKGNRNKRQTCGETITPEQVTICVSMRHDCMINCNKDDLCEMSCPVCPTLVHIPFDSGNTVDIMAPVYTDPHKPVVDRTIIVESDDGTFQKYNARIDSDRKITTIIKLTNIINNTNIIDMPTNVNATNINHIHIYQNETKETKETEGKFGLGETSKGSCCFAVRPKSCRQSGSGVRCHHKRQKVCGQQCTARTIHQQTRKRCNQRNGCHRQSAYVPQPRPRCHHVEYWPYVNCGGQQEQMCDGCYDHYGYGHENFYGRGRRNNQCYGCYDDGMDYGPMYRRGPVLRPNYYHEPPCHVTGTCYEQNYQNNNGNGYFGNDRIDPVWGDNGENQYDQYDDDDVVGSGGDFPIVDRPVNVFPDDDYELEITPSKRENDTETDWGVPVQKCKVISDDGTITIRNCAVDEDDFNPYAVAPANYPYYEPVDYMKPRNKRRPMNYNNDYDYYAQPPPPPPPHQRLRRPPQGPPREIEDDYIYDEDDNARFDPDENIDDFQ